MLKQSLKEEADAPIELERLERVHPLGRIDEVGGEDDGEALDRHPILALVLRDLEEEARQPPHRRALRLLHRVDEPRAAGGVARRTVDDLL